MTDQPHALVEKDGHIVTVTMNRPESRNAFSGEMLGLMAQAWEEIDADDEVRVAILTGAGGTFCAGADLKAMESADNTKIKTDAETAWRGMLRHHRLRKPLIAAVEGYAVAGGTEILQATDIRVAAQGSTFGVAEVRRGLFPLGGSTVRLRRQIGYAKAMELLLTGDYIPASEALDIGLINRVVPDGEALSAAREIAEKIARNGPVAVQAVKRAVAETEGLPEEDALKLELEIGFPVFLTADAKEGPRAFKEKREPNFSGA